MKILMLDKSFIIDRRIALEAQTLRGLGHEVLLAAFRESGEPQYEQSKGCTLCASFHLTHLKR